VPEKKSLPLTLSFPEFPDPLDAEGNMIPQHEAGIVSVPLWYWIKITEYSVDVERLRLEYEAWETFEKP
jgi:hypothetical protein